MRILMVSEDVPYPSMGGLAKHALNLSRALVEAGHEVDFLGGKQHSIEVAKNEGIFGGWKELSLGMFLPPKRTWLAKRFAKVILRHAPRYDVIHYHGHVPNVARHIPRAINFVQTRHDQGSDCFIHIRFREGKICEATDPAECARCIAPQPNFLQRAVSAMAVRRFRSEVAESFTRHKTVFVSDKLQRNCARTLGPGQWGTTVHNFADIGNLKRAHQSALSEPTSSQCGEIKLFIAGKLYPPKGVEAFLEELLPRIPSNLSIAIAGDGGDEARLRQRFESEQVHFLGWCSPEKTMRMAALSNAVVVPSICEESFSTTILEALLLGKPTYALAYGGTPEMAKYAARGQLRLHQDMQALVQDLIALDADTSFRPMLDGPGGADPVTHQLLRIYQGPFTVPESKSRP
jgi:glycosyltransferase involved in cell wall biosynthesis